MTAEEFRESQGVSIPEWDDIIDKMLEAYAEQQIKELKEYKQVALELYQSEDQEDWDRSTKAFEQLSGINKH